MIQSFAPGEVTPEQAMQIGEELCDRYLKGDYQYVIAVHNSICTSTMPLAYIFYVLDIFTSDFRQAPSLEEA